MVCSVANKKVVFETEISDQNRVQFAALSGDLNPLHLDCDHANRAGYSGPVVHGAYSACLFSRLAGMHLPGFDCLLHGMRLKFVSPIVAPVKIRVEGLLLRENAGIGEVEVKISDKVSGQLYVDGSYQFGRVVSQKVNQVKKKPSSKSEEYLGSSKVLVTGASGGLGSEVVKLLGSRAIVMSPAQKKGIVETLERKTSDLFGVKLDGIVHCGWPPPSSEPLLEIADIPQQIDFHVSRPLEECLVLAKLLKQCGRKGARLILVGSSFSSPGRHGWEMPLYSLSKALVPNLVAILNQELAACGHNVFGVSFDILDGGMNSTMSTSVKQYHADRLPGGLLPNMADAAEHIEWLINARGTMASGAMLSLTGGAVP